MIPYREKVCIATPSYDRRLDIGFIQGLFQVQDYYSQPFFLTCMSDVGLARNNLAHNIINHTEYEWIQWIDSDIVFTRDDWELLWEGDEDIVCAEYSKKMLGEPPAQFGLGFTRVHRSVFEKISKLERDDGSEYAQRFYANGEMRINYFPTGCNSDHRWISEDRGFFLMAAMTDCKPRVETRTKLRHLGMFEYHYPEQIPHWGPRTPGSSEDDAAN